MTSVFTDIFNLSLSKSVIPKCFKQTTKVACINYYRPVALMSVAMKCLERLVMAHINTIITETLDPLQVSYHPNRSTDDAVYCTPHCPFPPVQKAHPCENAIHRLICILSSYLHTISAFNIIEPSKLINKLRTPGLNTSLCNWILDILTDHPQVVRVGNNTSATLILNTGAPRGFMLSPLLYSLFTHDCTARQDSNTIIRFADDNCGRPDHRQQ